jgi:peptidyl-prolyl cis-trans isomerase D
MMQFFRNAAKPIILVTTIAFFVWLVYDLSGLGSGSGLLTTTSVGKVNGVTVEARGFQEAVQQAIDNQQRQTGTSLSLEQVAQVRDQVWEQYIQDIIFRAEYEKHRIQVSSADVAEAIRTSPLREISENPEFQTDGSFDQSKYQRWLTSTAGQSAVPYLEQRYRDELLRGKLLRGVIGDVIVSDAAVWERFRDEKEQVKVGALIVDPATAIADQTVTVTPEEIDRYYRDHRDSFSQPKAAFLSYLSIPRLPDASDSAAALARVRALRDEIRNGAPFAEIARRESVDTVSGKAGGDLGEMRRAEVDPAFGAAAMSLPLKTLSEPVVSAFGVHLIEIESRKADSFKGRHILIPIEVTGTHRTALDRRADSLEQLAAERLEPTALDTAAAALKLAVQTAGPLVQGGSLTTPESGAVPDVSVWAFQAAPGEESAVIEAQKTYIVFRLDSLQPEGIPPVAAIRLKVEAKVRADKKRTAARELATRLLANGAPVERLAAGPGISYQEIGPFARLGAPLGAPALIGAAFGAVSGQVSGPVTSDFGVYLFESLARTAADSAEFTKILPQLRAQALQAARSARVRAYLAALRADAKIVDRRSDLFKTNAQVAASQPATPVPNY